MNIIVALLEFASALPLEPRLAANNCCGTALRDEVPLAS